MSYGATCWAWSQHTESSGQRLVLLALANACGGDEDDPRACWPSAQRIANETELGERIVRRHIDRLAEMGLITKVERRRRPDGSLSTWSLTVNFTTGTPVPLGEADHRYSSTTPTGTPVPVDHRYSSTAQEEPEITEPEKESEIAIARARHKKDQDSGFEHFYASYPRKKAPARARAAWNRLSADDRLAVMLGLSVAVLEWKRERTPLSYIPYPATWLNARSFEDTPEPTSTEPFEVVQLLDGVERNVLTGSYWDPTHKCHMQDVDWVRRHPEYARQHDARGGNRDEQHSC